MINIIKRELNEHLEVARLTLEFSIESIELAAKICIQSFHNGKKILVFGNGGSAADAQHFAAELTGRYKFNRKGLPAIALTTDTSAITAIANDFGYEEIFLRQVQAIANEGDVLIGISTSGKSKNIIKAFEYGSKNDCKTISLTSINENQLSEICDVSIEIPSTDTARIQEMHITICHSICHLIDLAFTEN